MAAAYATGSKSCGKLVTTGESTRTSGQAFILRVTSKDADEMSVKTLELIEENKLPTTEQYVEEIGWCKGRDDTYQISIDDLRGFFVTAYVLAFVLLLLNQHISSADVVQTTSTAVGRASG